MPESEAQWGTERGTVRHSEAQSEAELGQVAPRAINQAQPATGAGAEAAAAFHVCICYTTCSLGPHTHIIKASERERVAEKRQSGARTVRNARQTPDSVLW